LLKITSNTEDFVAEEECVVYFTAEWCNPCKQLKPQYGKVSVMDPETNYYVVDVDKVGPDALKYYGIQSIPQIFVMKRGEIIQKIEARNAEEILEELGK